MSTDLEKLQGAWTVTSLETDGRKMTSGVFDGSMIVVKGSRFTSLGMGATYEGHIELDPLKKPKTIDLVFTVGHAAGTRNLGIYKLDDRRWTICLATGGGKAPPTFATRPGTGFALETLERGRVVRKTTGGKARPKRAARGLAKVADAGPDLAPSGAATELEGEWAMVAGVLNGAALGENMVKWCRRIMDGNVTSVVAGPQVMLKATFTLDRSKMPNAIDYMNLEGANARKPQAGIFELKGDTLIICMSAPGKPRPGDFSSRAGDGRSYTTWRRSPKWKRR